VTTFLVWDPINDGREEGRNVEASSPLEAAEEFAAQDHDGQTDGMYRGHGWPVDVQDDDGRVWRYTVAWVEDAKLRAVKVEGRGCAVTGDREPVAGVVPTGPGLYWRQSFHDRKWRKVSVARGTDGLTYRQAGAFYPVGPDAGTPSQCWGGEVSHG